MNRTLLPFLLCFFMLALAVSCSKPDTNTTHDPVTAPLYSLIDKEYDEQEAYKTVAFVEQYWRVVGNEGFNKSIHYVENLLKEVGFAEESSASSADRLTYRIEHRPLEKPTWEPLSGSLEISDGEELLDFKTNRNMITINSYSTDGTQEFEVEPLQKGADGQWIFDRNIKGKVVFAELGIGQLFEEAVVKRGAAGVIAYRMPDYLQPEKNTTSIQFSRIPLDTVHKSWGVLLSYEAKQKLEEALRKGDNKIKVNLETAIYNAEELTLVAELKGSKYPDERLVFSAHVQEPGANDNASGVGTLAELAATSSRLLNSGKIDPERTLTFLFGDEIISTYRYVTEDKERAAHIKWGISLDMTGEDTEKTGGTFLIEKMPDPAAIWTRGDEKHSEWGGRPLTKEELMPHYLNDFILHRFMEQGAAKNWVVKVNPFEGGSDHTPFLRQGIPGLLLWHFTDQFYHTDNDRLDKVSPQTMKNVGTAALVSALILTGDQHTAFQLIVKETEQAALNRIQTEFELSKKAVVSGAKVEEEEDILATWTDWYVKSIQKTNDVFSAPDQDAGAQIDKAVENVRSHADQLITDLKNGEEDK